MTERERFHMAEQKQAIFLRDIFTCQNCGQSIYRHGTPQLAHKIAQSKANIKKYGTEVIHHALNMESVCCLACNDAMNIGNKPEQARELADKIRETLSHIWDTKI